MGAVRDWLLAFLPDAMLFEDRSQRLAQLHRLGNFGQQTDLAPQGPEHNRLWRALCTQ